MPVVPPPLPYAEFPLRAHRNGQWFKSVWNPRTKKSEQFYFGAWHDDPKGDRALHDPNLGWLARRSAIKAGTDNVRVTPTALVVTLGELMFPAQGRGGQWKCHSTVLNGMLWILRTGAPWRDLPQRYGKFKTVHDRLGRYRREGTFDRILKALRIRLDKKGKIDWDLWLVDGSNVRASRSAAGAPKKGAWTRL